MHVHLVDGTYELYRQHYGQASNILSHHHLPAPLACHLHYSVAARRCNPHCVATDHVIESFRNDLYSGYKTSEGMEPVLLEQIPVLEDALRALGVTVWAMEKYEATMHWRLLCVVACEDHTVHKVFVLRRTKT